MVRAAAEGTAQIVTTDVAGVGEKPNPAVDAVSNTAAQLGIGLQDRVQRGLVLLNDRPGAVVLVPIRAKRENLAYGYGKKARFSVMIRRRLVTPSSYPIDANASRGRARFFLRRGREPTKTRRQTRSVRYPLPRPLRPPFRHNLAARSILKQLLERTKTLLLSK